MRTLFLTSAGMQVREELFKVLSKSPKETRVAHVITAVRKARDTAYYEREKRLLHEARFLVTEIDLEGKTVTQLRRQLADIDVIYVQGGNVFWLLQQVKASGFQNVANELIDRGVIYVGASAGTYLCCPTIAMGLWKGKRETFGLTNYTGLSFVPFCVFVHYQPEWSAVVKEKAPSLGYPLRILTDDQALLVRDGAVQLVGKGSEIVFA